jgi:hypothetical protein
MSSLVSLINFFISRYKLQDIMADDRYIYSRHFFCMQINSGYALLTETSEAENNGSEKYAISRIPSFNITSLASDCA